MKSPHHPNRRIVIVGAGITGLTCARALESAGPAVTVVDKSGDISGRLATRRRPGFSWNHGAPGLIAESAEFVTFLESLTRRGSATSADGSVRGVPDMRELLRPVAGDLDIRFNFEVNSLSHEHGSWKLTSGDGLSMDCDILLCTQPAPQALRLLAGVDDQRLDALRQALDAVTMQPRWILLLGFDTPVDLTLLESGAIIEAVRPGSGGRSGAERAWVIHASVGWSKACLEQDRAEITGLLLAALNREGLRAGLDLPNASYARAHRWRYAQTDRPLGVDCWWDALLGLGLAGDWCIGADAEHGFRSGSALAGRLLKSLSAAEAAHAGRP